MNKLMNKMLAVKCKSSKHKWCYIHNLTKRAGYSQCAGIRTGYSQRVYQNVLFIVGALNSCRVTWESVQNGE